MSITDSISVTFKLHQRIYESEFMLKQDSYGLVDNSWVWGGLLHASKLSKLRPESNSDTRQVLSLLTLLSANRDWQDLANLDVSVLTIDDVAASFRAIETAIKEQETWGTNTRHRTSIAVRKLLARFLKAIGFPKAASLHIFFRTQLPQDRFKRRQLISDQPLRIGDKQHWPVGAIPHETVEQLQNETDLSLRAILDKIAIICSETLDQIDIAKARQLELASMHIPQSYIDDLLANQRSGRRPAWIRYVPTRFLAAAVVRLARDHFSEVESSKRQRLYRTDTQRYLKELYGLPNNQLGLVMFPLGVSTGVLLACLLLLQIHTAWNANSVLELTMDGISGNQAPFQIQSFKSRVGKPSSIVAVERSDTDVVRAINFLVSRLNELKRLGWVSQDETQLWISDSHKAHRQLLGWQDALSSFQRKHGLPHFSLEQVRTQVLCLRGQTDGVEEMRRMAHHKSISTTGGYASQLMLFRKNEAINLEFQRRLEREVTFTFEDGVDSNTKLLWPIGDGTSCTDPTNPPFDDYITSGLCCAKNCHQGEGCSNRRVVIDRSRLEEALRTEHYYKSNWIRLLGQNRDAFDSHHLPSMIFNRALIGFVESGRYAYVVREVRASISSEIGK